MATDVDMGSGEIVLPGSVITERGPLVVGGVPEGAEAFVLAVLSQQVAAEAAQTAAPERGVVVHIARDDQRLAQIQAALSFFAPDRLVIALPAWDCVPYDRVSPAADIVARRVMALSRLAIGLKGQPAVVLTTINAALQRVPERAYFKRLLKRIRPGDTLDLATLGAEFEARGYSRAGTVMEPGEYAIRGGIVDVFPPARGKPVRIDLFGDVVETVRSFEPETQRSATKLDGVAILPMSEVPLAPADRSRFRQAYSAAFGPAKPGDQLYEAVTAGHRFIGVEHWLPMFHERLETVFDYVPQALVSLDPLVEDARKRRLEQIADHYEGRRQGLEQANFGAPPYKPVAAEQMFLTQRAWDDALDPRRVRLFSAFDEAGRAGARAISLGGRQGYYFAAERAADPASVFDAVREHILARITGGVKPIIACWSTGSRERLMKLMGEHGLKNAQIVANASAVLSLPKGQTGFATLGIERGFEIGPLAVIGEQDILGDKLIRPRRKRKASDVLTEATSLTVGDIVVHVDHGIGRFVGLKTIDAAGAPHDCLELAYHGGDKLFLPVENIELLSRYGSEEAGVQLDKLGSGAWQSRKARLKKRIRDIADKLMKIAALRVLRTAPRLTVSDTTYEEFAARFPYEETDDQAASIASVLDDLAAGRPMDRLVCGDVGFGKTEVALRAAFVAVMAGKQVAVVVPTTLLARQHYATFAKRFEGLPVRIAQASRLVSAKDLAQTKKELAEGQLDIVVGTHALLGKQINFRDLGLLIIDEEQHFGVQHKERLKELRDDVHVLTLTATPIPRTLQLALTGVRELSLITTPPVDRLAVRTFVTPFDPIILREAFLRERYRGGQSFYVCPRIADLDAAAAFLTEHVPELKCAVAHGQLAAGQLEDIMNAFYDRQYDVLLSTSIVESGLDIPTANTLVVHRADMFGLAALYQLRGRVGRSKTRAYAYFTIPPDGSLTPGAEKRLKVLQSLDTLGAGFALASQDMDLRGAGNLLGEEQSGHIKEVGFELYQSLLEETIAALKGGETDELEERWSPQITLGTAVLIPETYVSDLQLRLGLYRRLSKAETRADIDALGQELIDRFGPLPMEVQHLLEVIEIKALCRQAGIAQIEAGPKGAVVGFWKGQFAEPAALIGYVAENAATMRITREHKLGVKADWSTDTDRVRGVMVLARDIAKLVDKPAGC